MRCVAPRSNSEQHLAGHRLCSRFGGARTAEQQSQQLVCCKFSVKTSEGFFKTQKVTSPLNEFAVRAAVSEPNSKLSGVRYEVHGPKVQL